MVDVVRVRPETAVRGVIDHDVLAVCDHLVCACAGRVDGQDPVGGAERISTGTSIFGRSARKSVYQLDTQAMVPIGEAETAEFHAVLDDLGADPAAEASRRG